MAALKASVWIVAVSSTSWAAVFTNDASVNSFVRAAAPGSNYGAAGALSVSGTNAVNAVGVANGAFDTFIRFNTASMLTNFDAAFGTNNWVVAGATLQVTEDAAPNNALFNRGVGGFEIRWIANDTWVEGTGRPSLPTADGITYSDESNLLNPATDATLGVFTNAGASGPLSFALALPVVFVNDVIAGGDVGLFLTALDPGVGFTFHSHKYGIEPARPFLEISAVPGPGISTINLSGSDLIITAKEGIAGGTYYLMSSTNVALPLNQWIPMATNQRSANGEFGWTVTNATGGSAAPARFFLVQLGQGP
ncbi:MAG TPA: hypothetical protein VJA21_32365 [Verrucomicrobiae bacterium]